MRIRAALMAVVALFTLTFGSHEAKAAGGPYVCWVVYHPPGSYGGNYGDYGYVEFLLKSGIGCTGTYVGQYSFCTVNRTSTGCALSSFYSENSLFAVYKALVDAVNTYTSVSNVTDTCIGGSSGCGLYVIFRSD